MNFSFQQTPSLAVKEARRERASSVAKYNTIPTGVSSSFMPAARIHPLAFTDTLNTLHIYQALTTNPVQTLQHNDLHVQNIQGYDTRATRLAFCYNAGMILIQSNGPLAADMIAGGNQDTVIYRRMVATPMRGPGFWRQVGTTQQGIAPINPAGADLWVTDIQTGCTILILDWGGNLYSMVHFQPYTDNQYNIIGQFLMGRMSRWTWDYSRILYQNFWLKRDVTQATINTGGVPQRYIMAESMHANYGGWVSHVVGVRIGGNWQFFLQRVRHAHREAQELRWTPYYSFIPYLSY